MAVEGTYDYECMRSELLGIDKPDYEEFMKTKAEKEAAEAAALEAEANKESQAQNEYFGHTSGKLDELGNILKSTQKKINNLTAPFSMYLKSKMGLRSSAADPKDCDGSQVSAQQLSDQEPEEKEDHPPSEIKYPLRLEDKIDKTRDQMPLIDGLIDKTDKNVLSMEHQIKQMKKFK